MRYKVSKSIRKIYFIIFFKLLAFLIKINNFLAKHKILHDSQYGFQKNRSTQQALISFVDTLTEALDKNEYVVGLFLDLRKAFDTIDHSVLINKLSCYGIRGVALDVLKS